MVNGKMKASMTLTIQIIGEIIMTTKIYEATRAHHFIQKLKVLIGNARVKEHETKEAIDEIESFVNHILKELSKE
jgi:hypothetical protein